MSEVVETVHEDEGVKRLKSRGNIRDRGADACLQVRFVTQPTDINNR